MSEYDELFDADLDNNINFELCDENDEEKFDGLDKHAAQTWIYPTNLPLRQYQFDIVQTALFHNTMVSLPTGLGKTMIAAVVMYNMYRWYPTGRIIFMAPTRPLVAQQADACRKITCIPKDHTIQLTGDTQNTTRGPLWEKIRVFFITPQILQKDLQSKICPANLIRCIVIDEAHRARGNYAYCEVLRLLGEHASKIRILALSATPGATATQVAEVCRSLKISRLEIRTESSEDVKPYVFNKITETIVVPLGEPLASIRDKYIEILDQYTRRLMKSGVLTGSSGNIHKGRIFMVQKEYKENCQRMGKRPDNYILQDLTFCLTLYHAFDVLIKHGLRGFVAFYHEHGGDKGWVRKNERLTNLLNEIQTYLGTTELNVCQLPDGSVPEIDPNFVLGHPKFNKLRDICQQHFTKYPDTRVMIFCEYRDSVQEAFAALLTCRPLIRPRMFLGQSAISQKQQLFVMEKFRKGECNTLICTCVAEEGLDVAAVQLIICFDIANRSPIRLAQRMGRTGRHQIGRVVILVTEGREQQTLAETMQQSSLLDEKLMKSMIVKTSLLPSGPPVIPTRIQPNCLQLHMESTDSKIGKKQISPKQNRRTTKKADENEVLNFNQKLPEDNFIPKIRENLWTFSKDDLSNFKISKSNKFYSMFAPTNFLKQLNCKTLFGHSKDTEILTELYRKSEELKFNLPVKNIKSIVVPKTKNRDIREMFGKSVQSQQDKNDFLTPPKTDSKSIQLSQETQKISNSLTTNNSIFLSLLSEFTTNKTFELLLEKTCGICDKLFDCKKLTEYLKLDNETQEQFQSFTVPDESILDCLTYENLMNYDVSTSVMEYFNFEQFNREKQFEKLRKMHDPDFSIYNFHNPLTQGPIPQVNENPPTIYENSFNASNICNISFKSDFDSFIQNSKISDQNRIDKSMKDDFNLSKLEMSVQNQSMVKYTEKNNSIFEDSFNVSKLKMNKSVNNPLKFDETFNISELCYEQKDEKAIYELMEDNSFQNSKSLIENTTFEEYSNTKKFISNVSVYQPDEISKQALEFFGLNSIESLFDDEVRFEQNLPPKFGISKSSKQKNDDKLRLEQNLPPKFDISKSSKQKNDDKLRLEQNLPPKFDIPKSSKQKNDDKLRLEQNLPPKFDIPKSSKQKNDDKFRLEQNLPPKFDIPKSSKQKNDDKFRLEQNLPATKQMIVENKIMENGEKLKDYPTSPVLNTQKRFSSQTMIQSSSFFPKKTNFELWDESLFIDDSEIENQSENQHRLSPILNTQPSFRDASQSFVHKSQIFNSQTKVHSQKISPILSSQSQSKARAQEILNSQHHRNSDSQIPTLKTSPILCSQRSKSISDCNIDYLSDEDIFADEPVEDDLFFTAPTTFDDKSTIPKRNSSSQRENIVKNGSSCLNKLNQFRNDDTVRDKMSPNSSSQKENIVNNIPSCSNKLNQLRNNETVREKLSQSSSSQNENIVNNGPSCSNKLNQLRNNDTGRDKVSLNSSSQKENIVNNVSSCSNKLNQFRNNKLNMFQLKRNLNEVNSNIVNNAPKINFISKATTSTSYQHETDSDDESLLDFITRPSRKKLKLGLNKSNTSSNTITISDESIEEKSSISDSSKLDLKHSILISDESIENHDEDHDDKSVDLSVFSFGKKVLGQTNDGNQSLMGYEQHKNSGHQFRKSKKKKKRSEFIDYEAEISDDEEDDSDEDGDSDLESSFVVDNQTLTQTNVDMQALYLQSVKNNSQSGKFKIPNLPPVKMDEICSQADWNQTESNYVLDSFVVDNTIVMNEELSLLEIAEMELEKRKSKKRKNNSVKRKTSRIIKLSDSDSSEDEDLKRLRLECLNNQSVLR